MTHRQMYLAITALMLEAFFVPCDATYIVDLAVIEGGRSGCSEPYVKMSPGDGLNGDFNEGAGGKYIYLCVKYGGLDDNPITDLTVVAEDGSDSSCGDLSGWTRVPQQQGSNGDFNHGASGKYIYLCYKRDASKGGLSKVTTTQNQGDCATDAPFPINRDKDSNGDFNQGAGGKYIYMCYARACKATQVTGQWVLHGGQIASVGTDKWTQGTKYTHDESKTDNWKESVTAKVSQGWSLFGQKGSIEITGSVAHETSSSYSSSWSQEASETYEVEYTQDMIGKQPWKFEFAPSDSCGHSETSAAPVFAVTAGGWQPPCCAPSFATDAPTYKVCKTAEVMIANGGDYGCTVAPRLYANSSSVLV